jgi:2-oxoglutarate dehydrogenase E1 component
MFHLLRRQMKRPFRKPLMVMTPKSLLRNPLAVSNLSDMTSGGYREVLDDPAEVKAPKRVLLCAGKVFYDLLAARNERLHEVSGVAIVRIEQFYPFPEERLREVATRYADSPEWVWVQEEPRNMGAWEFLRSRLKKALGRDIRYLGRPASPVASSGHLSIYREEQAALVSAALGRS